LPPKKTPSLFFVIILYPITYTKIKIIPYSITSYLKSSYIHHGPDEIATTSHPCEIVATFHRAGIELPTFNEESAPRLLEGKLRRK
jgi:hypothetical protein